MEQQEARSRDSRPRTLHTKEGFKSRPQKTQVPKGHEAFLKALETSGATVEFEKMSGIVITGVIRCSDKYTISVNDGKETRVLFKHDLSEFKALTPRPEETKTQE